MRPDPIASRGTITYSLAVSNIGPDLATNVIVTDILPAGITLTNVTPSVGSCTGTSTITCDLGTIPSTQTERITIVGVATTSGNPINRATVKASSPEIEENNNTVAVNTTVVGGNRMFVTVNTETGASGQITSRPEGIACPPDCTRGISIRDQCQSHRQFGCGNLLFSSLGRCLRKGGNHSIL